jgi:23S rRNA (guanosine2251-2'-O)-methyltransferase
LNPLENGKKTVLILDQISDARNFGAIIRTAECTGKWYYCSEGRISSSKWNTVKHLQEPCSIFLFVKWNTSKMLFSIASERHKTVAATEKPIKLFMI